MIVRAADQSPSVLRLLQPQNSAFSCSHMSELISSRTCRAFSRAAVTHASDRVAMPTSKTSVVDQGGGVGRRHRRPRRRLREQAPEVPAIASSGRGRARGRGGRRSAAPCARRARGSGSSSRGRRRRATASSGPAVTRAGPRCPCCRRPATSSRPAIPCERDARQPARDDRDASPYRT